jgi:hypothetical protein
MFDAFQYEVFFWNRYWVGANVWRVNGPVPIGCGLVFFAGSVI